MSLQHTELQIFQRIIIKVNGTQMIVFLFYVLHFCIHVKIVYVTIRVHRYTFIYPRDCGGCVFVVSALYIHSASTGTLLYTRVNGRSSCCVGLCSTQRPRVYFYIPTSMRLSYVCERVALSVHGYTYVYPCQWSGSILYGGNTQRHGYTFIYLRAGGGCIFIV